MRTINADADARPHDLPFQFEDVDDKVKRRPVDTVYISAGGIPSGRPAPTGRRKDDLILAGFGRDHLVATLTLEQFTYRMPRGVAWDAYPLALEPRMRVARRPTGRQLARVSREVTVGRGLGGFVEAAPVLDVLREPDNVVVDVAREGLDPASGERDDDRRFMLAWATLVCRDLAPNIRRIGYRGGETLDWYPVDDLLRALAGPVSLMRLDYSYRTNAHPILTRALLHVLQDLDDAMMDRNFDDFGFGMNSSFGAPAEAARWNIQRGRVGALTNRYTLQYLFRLARMGKAPVQAKPGKALKTGALDGLFGKSTETHLLWEGKGKHPGKWVPREDVDHAARWLATYGLIRRDGDGVRISPLGERFLECLHPDMEDPDMLCRWSLMDQDYTEQVDAWILRNFRKTKTKVNKLPTYEMAGLDPINAG